MPYWKIYHGVDAFTTEEKDAIAKSVTNYYVSVGLPDFYVNIFFIAVPTSNFYVAGQTESKKVSVEMLHIARQWDRNDYSRATRFKNRISDILAPFTTDKGLQLEFCVVEGPAQLWRINGIDPPEGLGPDQQELAETNKKLLEQSV